MAAHLFGERELNRSQCDPETRFQKKWDSVESITEARHGQKCLIRARLQGSRTAGANLCFIVLRERYATVQCVLRADETITKGMVKYASKVPNESIVEIVGTIMKPEDAVQGCT